MVNRWSSPPLPILASQGICMSLPDPDAEVVDLTLTFGGLSVSVRGSPDRAAAFVRDLASQHSADSASPTRLFQASASTASSYSIVSGPPASSFSSIPSRRSSTRTSETRSSIRASFTTAPGYLLDLSADLVGSRLSGHQRVERAWLAGCWAGAVKSGRIGTPDRSPAIELGNRFYVVTRCRNLEGPRIFNSSGAFHSAVGPLSGTDTICHGFPTEIEARIYLEAAGEDTLLPFY